MTHQFYQHPGTSAFCGSNFTSKALNAWTLFEPLIW